MDGLKATAGGDDSKKHKAKNALIHKEQNGDHLDRDHGQENDNPWAKLSRSSCTDGKPKAQDNSCTVSKLPKVELINLDRLNHAPHLNDSAAQSRNDAVTPAPKPNGESVLKRLAGAASSTSAFDSFAQISSSGVELAASKLEPPAASKQARDLQSFGQVTQVTARPATSGQVESLQSFSQVTQLTGRPDGLIDVSGKRVSSDARVIAPATYNVPLAIETSSASASGATVKTEIKPQAQAPEQAKASVPEQTKAPVPSPAQADSLQSFNQTKIAATDKSVVANTHLEPAIKPAIGAASVPLVSALTSKLTNQNPFEPTTKAVSALAESPSLVNTSSKGFTAKAESVVSNNDLTAKGEVVKASTNSAQSETFQTTGKSLPPTPGVLVAGESGLVAAAKGAVIGAGAKGEVIAPAKGDGLSVSAEIKLPNTSKGRKPEGVTADDIAAATNTISATGARVFTGGGVCGNGGYGTASGSSTVVSNSVGIVSGQFIDPTTGASMVSGSVPLSSFVLPPLEIVDGNNGKIEQRAPKASNGPTQKELAEAFEALVEKRRRELIKNSVATTSGGKKAPIKNEPVSKPEKQRRCLVLKGDTLESLASQYLGDGALAELIYEINKGFWREKRHAGKIQLEFIAGSTIFLPTEEEIAKFRIKKIASGKPYLTFECVAPRAIRSLRQSVKNQAEVSAETIFDTRPPVIFTAGAPAKSENSLDKTLAVQLISHISKTAETSRILLPNQAKQLRDLEQISRVTVIGEQSCRDASPYVARIEVLRESSWSTVMEYIIDGDARLRIYSSCGKMREINLDLPLSIVREMALNDLTVNRIDYSKKYLLGRKIFC